MLDQLLSNQILVGLSGTALLGGLVWAAKSAVSPAWRWFKSKWSVTVEFVGTDTTFDWLVAWLDEQEYMKTARRVSVVFRRSNRTVATSEQDEHTGAKLIPATGVHFFWWKRVPIVLNRTRQDPKEGQTQGFETVTITALTRDVGFSRSLLRAAFDCYQRDDGLLDVYRKGSYGDAWDRSNRIRARKMDSVILADGIKERLVNDALKFKASEEWYAERGLPYRRGYLLAGPPGTGKTSLMESLAGHLKADIYLLSPAAVTSDDSLAGMVSSVPAGAMLVIEDVDAAFKGREAREGVKVSFSGMLNAIDGLGAGCGRLLFLTTNRPEELDAALVRPGRCDIRLDIGLLNADQGRRFYQRFFPHAPAALAVSLGEQIADQGVSPAKLQEHFLVNIDDYEAASRWTKTVVESGHEQKLPEASQGDAVAIRLSS